MTDKISVFLTAYSRIDNVERILESLSKQTFSDFDVVLINNNIKERSRISSMVWDNPNCMNIWVSDQGYNAGTVARYVEARTRDCDFSIFLDDDVILRRESIQSLVDQREKGKAKSCLGYDFTDKIDDSKKVYRGKAKAIGTGMMIFDTDIIRDDSFLTSWKPEFYVCDDLWFCRYAGLNGYQIEVSPEIKVFLQKPEPESMIRTITVRKRKQEFIDVLDWH